MTILKELCVVAGTYESNGEEKKRWVRIGHLHETNDKSRQYITLEPMYNLAAFPLKDDDDRLYVNLFDPKPKEGKGKTAPPVKQQNNDGPNDDIPF